MDIYELANEYAEKGIEADYMDMHTGYIYGVAAYVRGKRFFGIELPIQVRDSEGNIIGAAKRGLDN